MLQNVLDVLAENGVETELVELADCNIKYCVSCNKCMKGKQCSINDDDMPALLDKLEAADGIILGSPVYWMNVSAMMKNFMDRTRPLHLTKNYLDGKVGAVVSHAALRHGGQESCSNIMSSFLSAQGLVLVGPWDPENGIQTGGAQGSMAKAFEEGKLIWNRSVTEDDMAIQSCRQLGMNMLKLLNRLK